MSDVQYVVRYLEPKQSGAGEIVFGFGATEGFTLSDARDHWPARFAKPGFYSLMTATGQTLTVTLSTDTALTENRKGAE